MAFSLPNGIWIGDLFLPILQIFFFMLAVAFGIIAFWSQSNKTFFTFMCIFFLVMASMWFVAGFIRELYDDIKRWLGLAISLYY